MFYVRGNPRDYDRWEEMGYPTWNWEKALKYFKKSEGNRNENFIKYKKGKYHNYNGTQIFDSVGKLNVHSRIFVAAGIESGVKYLDDINADEFIGYTHSQSFASEGRRPRTAKSYLIHIVKYAHV